MRWIHNARRFTPVALALGSLTLLAAPIIPMVVEASAGSSDPEVETTISIRPKGETTPTVVRVPDMKVGEVQTITTDSGKGVTISRTESGYTLKVGDKEYNVRTDICGGGDANLTVLGAPGAHAFTFRMREGDGPADETVAEGAAGVDGKKCQFRKVIVLGDGSESGHPAAKAILEKQGLKALEGADARTRETVEKALDELMAKGAVFPMPRRIAVDLNKSTDGEQSGDRVEIRVVKKTRP